VHEFWGREVTDFGTATHALLAVIAILLLEFSGAIPKSSVGGPLTLMLFFLLAMLAVGLYEAWSKKLGVLGWIVSVVVSVVGGFVGAAVGGAILGSIITPLQPEGSLVATRHPLLYVSLAGQMIFTLLGSWLALQIVSRLR
jgi:hypothetical protein